VGGLPTDRTVYALHAHPQAPRRLLAALQEGLYRSADAGKTWHKVELALGSHLVAFAYHPETPELLFAVTSERAIVTSTDGGVHWAPQRSPASNR
jgi:photosystem II stability/assembly factor-like uncharacterized protein